RPHGRDPDARMAARPATAVGRRAPRWSGRHGARAARAAGGAADASRRLRRLGALHARLGLRLPRLHDERRRARAHRPDAHRGADRERHRLPRRRRDHPPGALGPRPDDGGDALARRGHRHGLRRRLLQRRGDRDRGRAPHPRPAAVRVVQDRAPLPARDRPAPRRASGRRKPGRGPRGDRAGRRARRLARRRAARARGAVGRRGGGRDRRRPRGPVDRVTVVLASRNAHKARELEVLLPGWEIEPLEADDWPEETGETYVENALAKARFAHERSGGWALGEDSGIEVAALGGRPGVYSARYAPEGAPAIAKLLAELGEAAERGARYVSELVAVGPGDAVFRGTGVVEG